MLELFFWNDPYMSLFILLVESFASTGNARQKFVATSKS
jgi:hypothetical protein